MTPRWLLLLWLFSTHLCATDYSPSENWYSRSSAHFRVHFHHSAQEWATQTLSIAEQTHALLAPLFDTVPQHAVEIVLQDRNDFTNGAAIPLPANQIILWRVPGNDFPLEDYAHWLESLIIHEYSHILHLNQSTGLPQRLRQLLGRHAGLFSLLLFPNIAQPLWGIEGFATWLETDRKRGVGRGQSRYFDMFLRLEAEQGLKPLSQVNQPFIASLPGGHYLYGVAFFNFLHKHYGQQALFAWVKAYSSNLIPYRLSTFKRVFGKSLSHLWQDFTRETAARTAQQRQQLEQQDLRRGEKISAYAQAWDIKLFDVVDDSLYYRKSDGTTQPGLYRYHIPSQQHIRLSDLRDAATSVSVHAQRGILVSQPAICHNTQRYYDLYLWQQDNGWTRLTTCSRYRLARWSPDGQHIAAIRYAQGRFHIDQLTPQGQRLKTLWQAPPEVVIKGLDWSADHTTLLSTLWRPQRGWNIERFTLDTASWQALTADSAVESGARYTPDGHSVVFTSEHGGIYDIRKKSLQDNNTVSLSRVWGGAFNPIADQHHGIYTVQRETDGWNIFYLPAHQTDLAFPTDHSPAPRRLFSDAPTPMTAAVPYQPKQSLKAHSALPWLLIESQRREIGFSVKAEDILKRHQWQLGIAWDTADQEPLGSLAYRYNRWLANYWLTLSRTKVISRDAVSLLPQKKRQFDSLGLAVSLPIKRDDFFWNGKLAYFSERARDVSLSDPLRAANASQQASLSLSLHFDDSRQAVTADSPNQGQRLWLTLEQTLPYSGHNQLITLDWRRYYALPARQTLGLRLLAARADLEASVPSFDGNIEALMPGDEPIRTSPRHALRGYSGGLSALSGRRLGLLSLEWRLPITRLERGLMSPPVALEKLSLNLFLDTASVGTHSTSLSVYQSLGAEFNSHFFLGYQLPLQVRLGLAYGLDPTLGGKQFYLTLGQSF